MANGLKEKKTLLSSCEFLDLADSVVQHRPGVVAVWGSCCCCVGSGATHGVNAARLILKQQK